MARNTGVSRVPERQKTDVPVRGGGPVSSLREEVNHLFDRFMGRPVTGRSGRHGGDLVGEDLWARDPLSLLDPTGAGFWRENFGQTDFSETDDEYEVQIDLPGLKRDDVDVDYADGVLTVSGERTDEREDERKGYYLSERGYGYFRRSFRVPDNVDQDNIGARFADGVLTIRLPKTEEARRNTRRIEVREG